MEQTLKETSSREERAALAWNLTMYVTLIHIEWCMVRYLLLNCADIQAVRMVYTVCSQGRRYSATARQAVPRNGSHSDGNCANARGPTSPTLHGSIVGATWLIGQVSGGLHAPAPHRPIRGTLKRQLTCANPGDG